jgi:hypothetical protein
MLDLLPPRTRAQQRLSDTALTRRGLLAGGAGALGLGPPPR